MTAPVLPESALASPPFHPGESLPEPRFLLGNNVIRTASGVASRESLRASGSMENP
jgi:hypothetical protein